MISKNTDVKITLTTVQHADETLRYTQHFNGRFAEKNGTYFITYTDDEPCIITLKQGVLRLSKPQSGSALVFEQSCEHICGYMTPAGKMSVSVFTHKLLDLLETDKRIFIKYRLTFNEAVQTENDITIKIEER